ncbi:MAG: AsmA-like C-terminal domain-containing protein [Deltaproteobacteria bacterium]|nr:AsmA-like C-terminal domain-containing protein [Deltaproteobacteria bacterium]
MQKYKRIIIPVSIGLAAMVLLMGLFLLFSPLLVNLDFVRKKIKEEFSRVTGGQVHYEQIDLTFLPYPHLIVREVNLSLSDKYEGKFGSIHIYPKILPLLGGKFRFARLGVRSFDTTITLPAEVAGKTQDGSGFSSQSVWELVRLVLMSIARSKFEDLIIFIEDGRLRLQRDNRVIVSLSALDASSNATAETIEFNIQCRSGFSQKISVTGALDRSMLNLSGQINLSETNPDRLLQILLPQAAGYMGQTLVNLNANYEVDGLTNLKVAFNGSIPVLTIVRGKKSFVFKAEQFAGTAALSREALSVVIDPLKFAYPGLEMVAKFSMNSKSPRMQLELTGKNVDVKSVRKAALFVGAADPDVRKVFGIIRGGKVPSVTIKTHGDTAEDLDDLPNLSIKGNIIDGKIFVPGPVLDLTDVTGQAMVSRGVLKGIHASARLGESVGKEGTIIIDLGDKKAPFHLNVDITASLSQLPAVLKRLVKDKVFLNEISRLSHVMGAARGKLILGGSLASIDTHIDVSEFSMTGKYQRFPFPFAISGGRFSYKGKSIVIENVTGSSKGTKISRFSARINLGKSPTFQLKTGKSQIHLNDIYPWLLSFKQLNDTLVKIRDASGWLEISSLTLNGMVFKPERWKFDILGEVKDLSIQTSLMPEKIHLSSGWFNANHNKLSFKHVYAKILDAIVKGSGSSRSYLSGIKDVILNFEGALGSEATLWASGLIDIPKHIRLRPPLRVPKARLIYNGNAWAVVSRLEVQKGPIVDLDIVKNPHELKINSLTIRDEHSQAAITILLKQRVFDFSFRGKLSKETLDLLLVDNKWISGWISGDVRAHILLNRPMESTAYGKLAAQGLEIPGPLGTAVSIARISLAASSNTIDVKSSDLDWMDQHIELGGHIGFSRKGIRLDIDMHSDGVDWNNLSKRIEGRKKKTRVDPAHNRWPVYGLVKLRADYFKYRLFTWRSIYSELSIGPRGIDVKILKARLCDISTPGRLIVSPGGISFYFKTLIKNEPLKDAVVCLTNETWRAGGRFDLDGNFTARGGQKELFGALRAELKFVARKGRINRFGMLAKIFELINVSQIVRMKLPDLEREGFSYKTIHVKANIQNGKLLIKEVMVDSPAMQIACSGSIDLASREANLLVLAAPLQTVNIIVKNIPILNYILGNAFITIPIRVTGDVFDPEVTAMNPKDVGANVVEIMKRTLKTPFKIIHPDTFKSIKEKQEKMLKKVREIEPSRPVPDTTTESDSSLH